MTQRRKDQLTAIDSKSAIGAKPLIEKNSKVTHLYSTAKPKREHDGSEVLRWGDIADNGSSSFRKPYRT
jgi:hypothetical protein